MSNKKARRQAHHTALLFNPTHVPLNPNLRAQVWCEALTTVAPAAGTLSAPVDWADLALAEFDKRFPEYLELKPRPPTQFVPAKSEDGVA